ncbi:hypothetical protein [Paenarthrobacter sp. C1]|uniref:hypothetical protein n=1 Tax=Paenarthrobacter sp. C1 TaxID=3400220 RepID=UPI003BF57FA9
MTITATTPAGSAPVTGQPGPITQTIAKIQAEAVPGVIERLDGKTVLENKFLQVDTDTVRFPTVRSASTRPSPPAPASVSSPFRS